MELAKTLEQLYADNGTIRTRDNALIITITIDAIIKGDANARRHRHHDFPPDKFLANLPLTWLARMLVEHGQVEFNGLCTLTLDADDVPQFTIAESLELEIAEARDVYTTYGTTQPDNSHDFTSGDGKDA